MAGQGIERIPDSLGYLVLTEEGAVVSVSEFCFLLVCFVDGSHACQCHCVSVDHRLWESVASCTAS